MSNDPNKPEHEADGSPEAGADHTADDSAQQSSGSTPPPPGADAPAGPSEDERLWGMLVHLAGLAFYFPLLPLVGMVAGPLIVWAFKKNEMPFVDQQGKEALNFQITVFLVLMVLGVLTLIPFVGCLIVPLPIIVLIAHLVLTIIAAVQANDGKAYQYPFRIEFFA